MIVFPMTFTESKVGFDIGFEHDDGFEFFFGELSYIPTTEIYSGDYEVTPMIIAQSVPTAEKYMKYDMTVKAIPYFDVGNTAGGSTVYIGKEIE